MAWARYWEAATQVHFMFSKWSDSFIQLISYISTAEKKLEKTLNTNPEAEGKLTELSDFRERIAHDFSLISALGTHRLTHGDLGRIARRSEMYMGRRNRCCPSRMVRRFRHWDSLIVSKEALRCQDLEQSFKLPHFQEVKFDMPQKQIVRSRTKAMNGGPRQAGERNSQENPAGVSKRRSNGSSFVLTASNVTWSSELVILGHISPEERIEMNRIYENGDEGTQPDRVNLLTGWINEDINELVPLVGIPPPIMSRCYQELSNGMLGFSQATKMADIPFPFPFSQLMEFLLMCYTVLLPMYSAKFTGGFFSSPILAFILTVSFWSLSDISRELETPFADGPNQLPVIDMHERFVELVRRIYQMQRPDCGALAKRRPRVSSASTEPEPEEEIDAMEDDDDEDAEEVPSATEREGQELPETKKVM
mmetsp:Transcript_90142/g.280630  ORF Transcript_90142/g.280630 Transcript_90142/m.280630 type:complete len:422 (+) Transcript_90142:154-1419(+)